MQRNLQEEMKIHHGTKLETEKNNALSKTCAFDLNFTACHYYDSCGGDFSQLNTCHFKASIIHLVFFANKCYYILELRN